MTNLSEEKMRILYRNIYQGLKKKYPKAQVKDVSGQLLLVLKNGYIYLHAFEAPKILGGITIELEYVDKVNSPNYELPKLKNKEDDLNKKAILVLANEMGYEATFLFQEMGDRLEEMLDEFEEL